MIRRRLAPFLAALLLGSLLIGSALAPVVTATSSPSWSMTVEAVPEAVTSGDTAAYLVTITNQGRRLSKVSLSAQTPDGATLLQADPSNGTCATSHFLYCSLGSLKKNGSVTVLVVYQAPSTGDDLTVWFAAVAKRSGDDDHRRAHRDEDDVLKLVRKGETELIPAGDTDFAGRFVLDPSQRLVANDQAIGGSNQHATKVVAPEIGIATWVEDIEGFVNGCGGEGGLPCFGAISEVHVNDGALYPDGFKVTITFGVGELPLKDDEYDRIGANSGSHEPETIQAKDLNLQHELDNGSTEIIPRCGDVQDVQGSEAPLPCFEAKNLYDGSIRAKVFLTQNGLIQGW